MIVVGISWLVVNTFKNMMSEWLILREGYIPCDLDKELEKVGRKSTKFIRRKYVIYKKRWI